MQAVTVFFPIYEYYSSNQLSRSIIAGIKDWEDRKEWNNTTSGSWNTTTSRGSITSDDNSTEASVYKKNKIYTMAALERVLTSDPYPLLCFAATQDFTAENVLFLMAVRDWRSTWPTQSKNTMFSRAVDIYATKIDDKLAQFPINIEWRIKAKLEEVFGPSVSEIKDRQENFNEAAPFANPGIAMNPMTSRTSRHVDVFNDITSEKFDETVFDAAEKSVKYLVLTNTWRKYISQIQKSRNSEETLD
jgi:hypothetical protein